MTSTYRLLIISLATAIIAVLSQLTIPLGTTPITLQTFAVGLIASLLKRREAMASIALYILLGTLGLPVFAGGSSGLAAISSPTAGFIWGFLLYAFVTGTLLQKKFSSLFMANLLGEILLFLCGVLSLHYIGKLSLPASFLTGVLPFIPIELIKIGLITLIAPRLKRTLKSVRYFK